MSIQRVARRYANSLLEFALEKKDLESVNEDIQTLSKSLQIRDLFLFVKSPIIHNQKKREILQKIFSGKLSKTTLTFIDILTRKGRENILPEIGIAFQDLYNQYKQISHIKVTIASELTAELEGRIQKKLLDSGLTYPYIIMHVVKDSSIIGGFIIEFGDLRYDASLAYKLKRLKSKFVDKGISVN